MSIPTTADEREKLSEQCRLVLSYLKHGKKLTNLLALTMLGVGSLSSRVAQLKQRGYNIKTERSTNPETGKSFDKYYLDGDEA